MVLIPDCAIVHPEPATDQPTVPGSTEPRTGPKPAAHTVCWSSAAPVMGRAKRHVGTALSGAAQRVSALLART